MLRRVGWQTATEVSEKRKLQGQTKHWTLRNIQEDFYVHQHCCDTPNFANLRRIQLPFRVTTLWTHPRDEIELKVQSGVRKNRIGDLESWQKPSNATKTSGYLTFIPHAKNKLQNKRCRWHKVASKRVCWTQNTVNAKQWARIITYVTTASR